MDALIPCGGYARRLEPITEFVPKQMLFIKNKPIIDYVIDHAESLHVNRSIVSTNKRFSMQFKYWLEMQKASGRKNIELIVEPTVDHEDKFGVIRGLNYAVKFANIKDDLVIILGDNYFEFDLTLMVKEFEKTRRPLIALYDVKSIEDAKMFGVVCIDKDKKIVDFAEKPDEPKSTLISTGIYFYPKEYLGKFKEYLEEGKNPDQFGHFFEWLIHKESVYGYVYDSKPWFDIGTITTYRKLFYQSL